MPTKSFLLSLLLILLSVFYLADARAENQDDNTEFDAHATAFKYFFNDADMDFHFGNLILGSIVNKGAETGEAFYAASQIDDGNAESWQQEWCALAERVAARGTNSLKSGHKASARDLLQRAAYYYRLSILSMLPDNPEFKARILKARELMRQAGKLFTPEVEYIEIPFADTVLTGYFRKADNTQNPAKTLLMIGGGETFAEDLFFYLAPQAYARGYNFLCIDLPGQGLLPLEGHTFRPDMNVPLKAVVDYALQRSDVDKDKLAAFGISGGGGFVPQAAMHDKRIKAIAMSSAVVDAYPLFQAMPVTKATAEEMAAWSSFHRNIVEVINWRWGVPGTDPAALVDANKGFAFEPKQVAQPVLLIVGEGEFASQETKEQQEYAMENFPNQNKQLVITPASEGAANHCIMENRSLVGVVLFDWLDQTFAE